MEKRGGREGGRRGKKGEEGGRSGEEAGKRLVYVYIYNITLHLTVSLPFYSTPFNNNDNSYGKVNTSSLSLLLSHSPLECT